MSTKEQVKNGKVTPQEAMATVSKDSHTYGWCKRRIARKIVVPPVDDRAPAPATVEEKPKNKYKRKKHEKQ